jgi:hypothetical protein
MVLLGSMLSPTHKRLLADLAAKHSTPTRPAQVVDELSDDVTHLVVAASRAGKNYTCRPTYKYLWAVSRGIWVVRDDWLEKSKLAKRWSAEESYEVGCTTTTTPSSTASSTSAAASQHHHHHHHENLSREYRLLHLRHQPRPFEGRRVYLGPFPTKGRSTMFDREQCETLLRLNGAVVEVLESDTEGHLLPPYSASFVPFDETGCLMVAGHPNDLDHRVQACEYCQNLEETLPTSEGFFVMESAWLMICLVNKRIERADERVLLDLRMPQFRGSGGSSGYSGPSGGGAAEADVVLPPRTPHVPGGVALASATSSSSSSSKPSPW